MWDPASALRRLPALLPLLVASAVGCSDPTDPSPAVAVQIQAAVAGFSVSGDAESRVLECEIAFTASATGRGGAEATWAGATVRFLEGADRSTPIDSLTLPTGTVRQVWNAERIAVGEVQRGLWSFWSRVPFTLQGEVRYRPEGARGAESAPFRVACGPDIPEGGVAPPTIGEVRIEPADGELEPDPLRPLRVSYTASSPVGLWETRILVSGAFSHQVEETVAFDGSVTRTVEIPVPPSARLGEPVRVQVEASDAALQTRSSEVLAGPTLVDRTPPRIEALFLDQAQTGTSHGLAADLATTDTLRLRVVAGDNHRLAYLVYELGSPAGFRDSLRVAVGSDPYHRIDVPMRAEWAGSPILSVQAVDAAGLQSEVRSSLPDSIRIYPEVARTTHSLELDGVFRDAALDPARDRLYLALPQADAVEVVDLSGPTSVTRLQIPGRPASLDLAPDGRTLAVALADRGAVALLDPSEPTAAPRLVPLDSAVHGRPWMLRYRPDGRLIVLAVRAGEGRLVELDPATGRQTARTGPTPASWFDGAAARADDFSTLVLTIARECSVAYSPSADRFSACRPLRETGSLSVSADGARIAKGHAIYDRALQAVRTLPDEPFGTYTTGLSPDGGLLFLSTTKGVLRRGVDDGAPLDRSPLAPIHDGLLRVARGGGLLVAVGRYPQTDPARTRVFTVELD